MITWGPHGLDPFWDVIERDQEFYVSHYGLDGEQISMRHWVYLVESRRKVVKQEYIGDYFVSTVLIGLDHSYGHGPPLIFETMVFKSNESNPDSLGQDLDMRRYSTWAEALEGHREITNEVALLAQLDS